jgi:hypothetical protein
MLFYDGLDDSRSETPADSRTPREEDSIMKRLMLASMLSLGLVATGSSAQAACRFSMSCGFNVNYESSGTNRSFCYNKCSNPLPGCCPTGCCYSGPAVWDGLAAYGAPGYGHAAPVAAAPAAAPAAPAPSFQAPAPKQSTSSTTALQQAGYFYYGPSNYGGYSSNAGYNYGASYFQAPNYWYGN